MDETWTEDEAGRVAARFFQDVASDLLKHGGVRVGREMQLRRSPAFVCAVYDRLAVILARKYHQSELDYETADWFANQLESELTQLVIDIWPKNGGPEPKLWHAVYEAFDAGEFYHFGRSTDPVAEFTNPQIIEFLSTHD